MTLSSFFALSLVLGHLTDNLNIKNRSVSIGDTRSGAGGIVRRTERETWSYCCGSFFWCCWQQPGPARTRAHSGWSRRSPDRRRCRCWAASWRSWTWIFEVNWRWRWLTAMRRPMLVTDAQSICRSSTCAGSALTATSTKSGSVTGPLSSSRRHSWWR